MDFFIVFLSMGIGAVIGFMGALKWFIANYNWKLKNWSEKISKLSKQVIDVTNRYEQKERELKEKYGEKD